ncbi:hypothetical protein FHW69_002573 [Luteibacter sp. Sphag1AF]|uniref:hypothetical protein n=1 Tax=Luteibacter sp. Sphag1AF TaxID=2587031 RepID=UPI00160D4EDF|nr:hypothetical protein [Luteibacter sp. Sphag1AF]MBB3227941.1 hypothetical protein [Luteibacter sp. Sphag1AF]
MASMFTGLAFLHGHITNRELIWSLARPATPAPAPEKTARKERPVRAASEACTLAPCDCVIAPRHAC